jgi:HNH endonuclease
MNPRNTAADFWKHVKRTPDCWLWTGRLSGNGYGNFSINWKSVSAHKFAYEQVIGKVPSGMTLDHICRVRHCVNPLHLRVLTRKANVLCGIGPTACNARKTLCKNGHPLDAVRKNGGRRCKTCARLAWHRKKLEFKP